MLELLSNPQAWIAFATLTALELVLGIDNVIFISILVDKLPRDRREFTRRIGLFLAMFMRIGLLLLLSWIVGLVAPLFTVMGEEISGRDLILAGRHVVTHPDELIDVDTEEELDELMAKFGQIRTRLES